MLACILAVGTAPHACCSARYACISKGKLQTQRRWYNRHGTASQQHARRCHCLQVCAAANAGYGQFMYTLPCGLHLEVLHQAPAQTDHQQVPADAPPLLFLHGAAHGAWCWQENFMPYFAAHGMESYAISLRGHGNSDPVEAGSCSLADQLEDVSSFIRTLRAPPVLIGHSIGGFIAQRYLERLTHSAEWPAVAAAALLANSGPRELMPTLHWLQAQRSLWHSARVFLWMMKRPAHDASLVRDMFFSRDLPEEHFARYHRHIRKAGEVLPITSADMNRPMQLGPLQLPPVLALVGSEDGIVMPYQLQDAADFWGGKAVVVQGVAHDLMLDTRWEEAAKVLLDWFVGVAGVATQASVS